jgi:hypothetical protein
MPDTSIVIRDANGVTYPIDVRSIPGGDTRQVLLIGDGENSGLISPATEDTLTAILAELATKLDAGGTITVGTMPEVEVKNDAGAPLSVKQVGVAPPLGYAQASVTAAQALPTVPANTVTALVVPRAPIRWRDDGTNPTTAVGMYLAADQALEYRGSLAAFRMISVAGTAEVNVSFYGAEA